MVKESQHFFRTGGIRTSSLIQDPSEVEIIHDCVRLIMLSCVEFDILVGSIIAHHSSPLKTRTSFYACFSFLRLSFSLQDPVTDFSLTWWIREYLLPRMYVSRATFKWWKTNFTTHISSSVYIRICKIGFLLLLLLLFSQALPAAMTASILSENFIQSLKIFWKWINFFR